MTVVIRTPPLPTLPGWATPPPSPRYAVEAFIFGQWTAAGETFDTHAAASQRACEIRAEFPRAVLRVRKQRAEGQS